MAHETLRSEALFAGLRWSEKVARKAELKRAAAWFVEFHAGELPKFDMKHPAFEHFVGVVADEDRRFVTSFWKDNFPEAFTPREREGVPDTEIVVEFARGACSKRVKR